MYPNLYYLFEDLFGIRIEFLKMFQSFGFFVAVAFVFAAWVLSKELRRKEREGLLSPMRRKVIRGAKASPGELLGSGIVGFVLFYKIVYVILNFSAFLEDTQGFLLSLEGSFPGGLLGGAAAAYLKYSDKEKERKKLNLSGPSEIEETLHPWQEVGNITLIAAVAGLLGAKLFDILENLDSFAQDPWGTIFSFSGLTMYGGLIVAAISVILYARKKGISTVHLIDASAPALMLAYGIGRIGCHIAGDGDWGLDNLSPKPSWMGFLPDWMWAYKYPHNVLGMDHDNPIAECEGKYCYELANPVFPTPFYEAVICIGLFFVLWALRKRIVIPGVLFSIYLIMNGVERFFIEKIRVNTEYSFLGMSPSQAEIIAVLLILAGIAGIFYFRKRLKPSGPPAV
ncbi:MAG: prolipoprotein diacylglyceryl transferase family protein [Bacteroidota bacterium]